MIHAMTPDERMLTNDNASLKPVTSFSTPELEFDFPG
jgi:hypothetical protein